MTPTRGPGQAAIQENWFARGRWTKGLVVKRPACNGLLGVRVGEAKNPGPEAAGDEPPPAAAAGAFRCPLCPGYSVASATR
eukprot:7501778-Prorocentrum_lima.AAC.1